MAPLLLICRFCRFAPFYVIFDVVAARYALIFAVPLLDIAAAAIDFRRLITPPRRYLIRHCLMLPCCYISHARYAFARHGCRGLMMMLLSDAVERAV